ncbi:endonuclease/exonuclease/phosphatase family protein [Solihabitans fulvus]|uniref:Endonuclease/exonuclease/phosphatase family protein n=1 Tax=Solihabitans fulvus TaxID=1892852 RepID=A0A5B2XHG5_9PSEU|nr:endonuclease/exonuclease/phosphatase family protein [Solihabitans fulvus]KAA2262331.1 endonuclease/exonuclease/phosphatase family protein [Solihabitans fulvus]
MLKERVTEVGAWPRRVRGGWFGTFVLLALAVAFGTAAVFRLMGMDGNRYMVAALALTPYLTAAGVLLGLLCLLLRRWLIGAVVLVLCSVLASAVVPRGFPNGRPNSTGQRLRVLSANLAMGRADPVSLVRTLRDYRVDVVSLQELTQDGVAALDAAGLADVLPYRVFHADGGPQGSGLASRYPVRELALAAPSTFQQPSAEITVPGGQFVEFVVVHAAAPVHEAGTDPWLRDLAGLPSRSGLGPVRVLAGDFNATVDHAALRRLLVGGYLDAAAEVGEGFRPTFPSRVVLWPPRVAIDHVLVDRRAPVEAFRTIDQPGSDHYLVFTELALPT